MWSSGLSCGASISLAARRSRSSPGHLGLSRNTIRRALRSERPPGYRRPVKAGVIEPFKDEIHRLLGDDPKLPGVRVRELLEPLGCTAGKTVVDDYLREVRPLFAPAPRTFQRTVYRPGEICQLDVWQPREPVAVGHGQTGFASTALTATHQGVSFQPALTAARAA